MKFVSNVDFKFIEELDSDSERAKFLVEGLGRKITVFVDKDDRLTVYSFKDEIIESIRRIIKYNSYLAYLQITKHGIPLGIPGTLSGMLSPKESVKIDNVKVATVIIHEIAFAFAVERVYLEMGLIYERKDVELRYRYANNTDAIVNFQYDDNAIAKFYAKIKEYFLLEETHSDIATQDEEEVRTEMEMDTICTVTPACGEMFRNDYIERLVNLALKYTTCCVPLSHITGIFLNIQRHTKLAYELQVTFARGSQSDRGPARFKFTIVPDQLVFEDITNYKNDPLQHTLGPSVMGPEKYNSKDPIPDIDKVTLLGVRQALRWVHPTTLSLDTRTEVALMKHGGHQHGIPVQLDEGPAWMVRIHHDEWRTYDFEKDVFKFKQGD